MSIPHQKLIGKIIYKARSVGINVIITEESYTSGTSFLDEELPKKEFTIKNDEYIVVYSLVTKVFV